jgi:arginine decarboxylase
MGVELTSSIGNTLGAGSVNGDETQSNHRRDVRPEITRQHLSATPQSWTIEQSEKLYRIQGWGEPYFSINAAGHVTVSPKGDRGGSLDLMELVEALRQRNLGLPLLIRFSDILEDRIERLNACFAKAIARYKYSAPTREFFRSSATSNGISLRIWCGLVNLINSVWKRVLNPN